MVGLRAVSRRSETNCSKSSCRPRPQSTLALFAPTARRASPACPNFNHCDVRYAVFYGTIVPAGVRLDHLILTTGADFFTFFRRFEGNVQNAKLQIPLPAGFFD